MRLKDDFFTLTKSEATADGARLTIRLNAGHSIYRAHFPGNPITPGACIVQMVGELAEETVGKKLSLSLAGNVKFLATIIPEQSPELQVDMSIAPQDDRTMKVRATVADGNRTYAKLSLTYKHD